MRSKTKSLYRLIGAFRVSFNRLKGMAEELHRDLGVNVSMRGVMESLADEGAKTVPSIAREKGVSRQHIQVNVDALLNDGMVEARDNPAHQRSPLITLTEKGKQIFAEARRREAEVLKSLAHGLEPKALSDAAIVLETLNDRLIEHERKRSDDDNDNDA
ncbi:MAG: MarR family winged helix-turn-helix transcriptional regulator [Hyphomicrobiales bacterium]